jgi:Rps23 Pro-64 3,4-dihydroxylase Tpa1-like proline 4-hydroxylase
MLKNKQFNIEEYFTKGFTVNYLDEIESDKLLNLVFQEKFNRESQLIDTNPLIPIWDTGYSNKTSDNIVPSEFLNFWKKLSQEPYFDYFNLIYGEFSQFNVMLHKYNQGTGLNWHQDVHEGVHITNVLYLTTQKVWNLDWGGHLELGKWNLDNNGWGIASSVIKTGEVLPVHGVLVSICNVVPIFCHKVNKLNADIERYSLICRFGYKENTDKNKIANLF